MSYRRSSEVIYARQRYDPEIVEEYTGRERVRPRPDPSGTYEREREARPSVLDRLGPVDVNYRDRYRHPDLDDKPNHRVTEPETYPNPQMEERTDVPYVEHDRYRNNDIEERMDDRYVEREKYRSPEVEGRVDERYAERLRVVKVVKIDDGIRQAILNEGYPGIGYRDGYVRQSDDYQQRFYERNGNGQQIIVERGATQRMFVDQGGTQMYIERGGNLHRLEERENQPRQGERGGEYHLEPKPRQSLGHREEEYERFDSRNGVLTRSDSRSVALSGVRSVVRSVVGSDRHGVRQDMHQSVRYEVPVEIRHEPRHDFRDIRNGRNDVRVDRIEVRNDTRNDVRNDVRNDRYGNRYVSLEAEYPVKERGHRNSHFEEEEHGRRTVRNGTYRPNDVHNVTYRPNDVHNDAYRPNNVHNDTYRPNNVHNDTYRPNDVHNDTYRPNNVHNDTYRPNDVHNDTFRRTEKTYVGKPYLAKQNGGDRRSPRPTYETRVNRVRNNGRSGAKPPSPAVYSENDPLSKGMQFFGYADLPPQVWEDAPPREYKNTSGSEGDGITGERGVRGVRRKLRDVKLDDRQDRAKRVRREEITYYGAGNPNHSDRHVSERGERGWGYAQNTRG